MEGGGSECQIKRKLVLPQSFGIAENQQLID